MGSLGENIMEVMNTKKMKHSLNPSQISSIQHRLTHIFSQFRTPDHPPYAAMIQRALQELKQKGGSSEKSISEFIKREYDDLPWAHCALLKHHLGLLSNNGEIILTRGSRYTLRGAGSSSGLIKCGKKHRRKKACGKFEAIAVGSEKEKDFEVIKDPSQVNDQSSQVAGDPVIDGLQSPMQDGTSSSMLLQLPKEDACQCHELSSPERPPGFEFMGVEVSNDRECSPGNSPPLRKPELAEQTVFPLTSEEEEKQRLRKRGRHPEGKQFEKVVEQNEIVLALPYLQKGSTPLRDSPFQNDRSQRQLRRWSGELPKALSSSKKSGKCPPVEIASEFEKSQPFEYTIITRRRAKFSSLPRQNAELLSASFCSSTDSPQDEGCSTHPLLLLPPLDDDMPLRKYQRRGRRPKTKTNATLQDETSLADISKQGVDQLPKLLCDHIPQEKPLESAVSKEVTVLNHKDHSEEENHSEPSKPRGRGRPPNRKRVLNNGKDDDYSPTRKKPKKSSNR